MVILIGMNSCQKEDTSLQKNETNFFILDEFTVSDAEGNQVVLQIQSNRKDLKSEFNASDFRLVTTTEKRNTGNTTTLQPSTKSNKLFDEGPDPNYYFIITDFSVNENITGFRVELIENELQTRWDYHYEYGANGVRGVTVTYEEESCGVEYCEAKLGVLETSSSWFYNQVAHGYAGEPGQDAIDYYSYAQFYKYRVGWRFPDDCSTNHSASHMWRY